MNVSFLKPMYLGASAIVCLVAACIFCGQPARAQLALHLGHRSLPNSPEMQAKMAKVGLLRTHSAQALASGQYTIAESDARQILMLLSEDGRGKELLASALYAQGKEQEASAIYDELGKSGNDAPRDLLPYALLLLKAGHYAQAAAAFDKALPTLGDILPPLQSANHSKERLLQANDHFSAGDPRPKDLETAIHIAMGLTRGGACSLGLGSQDDKMLAQFQQAVTLEPDSALAHLYFAAKLKEMNRGKEAEVEFKKADELGDSDVKIMVEKNMRLIL